MTASPIDQLPVTELTISCVLDHRRTPFIFVPWLSSKTLEQLTLFRVHFASLYCRPVLLVGLSALLLFVAGPQMGSLDADSDGIPEVPIVLARLNSVAKITTITGYATACRTRRCVASAVVIATPKRMLQICELKLGSTVGRLTPQSFFLLRC